MNGRSKKVSDLLELLTYQTALEKQEACFKMADRFTATTKVIKNEIHLIQLEKTQTARKARALANKLHVQLTK